MYHNSNLKLKQSNMSKYSKIISEIQNFKNSENGFSSDDTVLIKSFVDSILSGKLHLSKVLKIEGSVWTCSKIVYEFLGLNCDDNLTRYLKMIMPINKKEASKMCSEIWATYKLGEEVQVKSNDKHNTIIIKEKKCSVGIFIDFFERKALAAKIIDKKLINA